MLYENTTVQLSSEINYVWSYEKRRTVGMEKVFCRFYYIIKNQGSHYAE